MWPKGEARRGISQQIGDGRSSAKTRDLNSNSEEAAGANNNVGYS